MTKSIQEQMKALEKKAAQEKRAEFLASYARVQEQLPFLPKGIAALGTDVGPHTYSWINQFGTGVSHLGMPILTFTSEAQRNIATVNFFQDVVEPYYRAKFAREQEGE